MKRFFTRTVDIGPVQIGGNNPVRIQSMTNTDTCDVLKTADQIMRLEDCGCEIVRLAVQGAKEAYSCEKIKNKLILKGYKIPLVADIHFFPKAAMLVADFVDKIRINPGNFIKQAKAEERIAKVESEFFPLIEKLKRQKKALRIGVNHGSLSEKIMFKYGNTPEGMVESALEYGDICRKFDFHDLVFSMKSSNPIIMISSYRLLIAKMIEKKWNYPLHLGVTEAGDEDEGIIRSAFGIGALLLEGVGDTIRVSLTADPEKEIFPAKKIALLADKHKLADDYKSKNKRYSELGIRKSKREIKKVKIFKELFPVILEMGGKGSRSKFDRVDGFFIEDKGGRYICSDQIVSEGGCILLKNMEDIATFHGDADGLFLKDTGFFDLNRLREAKPSLIFFSPEKDCVTRTRFLNRWLAEHNIEALLIAAPYYEGTKEEISILSAAEIGSLLASDIIDGICIRGNISLEEKYFLTFSILQAGGKRTINTEYISCPGCGRTLYDIQAVTKNIKAKTSHLPGVKIAIMGCIVNGLGEMADADFGFIGSGKDRVDLYVGKRCVEKNMDFSLAEKKLVEIIKKEGRWIEKA